MTQDRINKFAEATCDEQWIHVVQERAKAEMPGGKTIAHGLLSLSLTPMFTRVVAKGLHASSLVPGRVSFVPAVVDAMTPAVVAGHERKTARRKAKPDVGGIEIEAEGVTIRVGRGADVAMIAAIVRALKASR